MLPALLLGFGAVVLFFYFFTSVPLPEDVGGAGTVILDVHGAEIATLRPEASREDVALNSLPAHVVDAVLAAEDAEFYSHPGVSIAGVFRAAIVNVTSGRITQGGSTISQQYVKNVTSDDARTPLRKIREAALAVKLERQFAKEEILEFYLNSIYFGRGAYGIEAAAGAYYGKAATELSEAEAVQLAGIIPSPSRLDPLRHPEAAERRYRYVLDQLMASDKIDALEAGVLAAEMPVPLEARPIQFRDAPFFLDRVTKDLAARVGEENIYESLRVTTTLDLRIQAAAESAYRDVLVAGLPEGSTGALVALDPATGGIRAMIGGPDHASDQLNLTERPRQPGSTFKPFALAAWVEKGMSPDSYFPGPASYAMPGTRLDGRPYEISNFGGAAYDALSLREATWRSVNTVYGQVYAEIGGPAMVDVAHRLGIDSPMDPADSSVVLGTAEVTPLELTEAYGTLAAGGVHREPITIERVVRDGEVVFVAPTRENRVVSEQVAWTVTDVLTGVLERGTARAAHIGRAAAGKTGTTTNHADAWFVGYTPQLAATVWIGNRDNNEPMPGKPTGGDLPAEVWNEFMTLAHTELQVASFPAPTGSLRVANPSPAPEPTAPECGPDETLDESGLECVPDATEEPEEPDPDADPGATDDDGSAAPVGSPSPSPPPESPSPSPSPPPSPSPSPSPSPFPSPTPAQPSPEPSANPAGAAPGDREGGEGG